VEILSTAPVAVANLSKVDDADSKAKHQQTIMNILSKVKGDLKEVDVDDTLLQKLTAYEQTCGVDDFGKNILITHMDELKKHACSFAQSVLKKYIAPTEAVDEVVSLTSLMADSVHKVNQVIVWSPTPAHDTSRVTFLEKK
jgi:hypothetical protein